MTVLPAMVAVGVAAYWIWELVRSMSVPPDWRWPQSISNRPSPFSFTARHLRFVAVAGIAASLAVVAFTLLVLW